MNKGRFTYGHSHELINEPETSLREHSYGTNVIYLMSEVVPLDMEKNSICYVLTSLGQLHVSISMCVCVCE